MEITTKTGQAVTFTDPDAPHGWTVARARRIAENGTDQELLDASNDLGEIYYELTQKGEEIPPILDRAFDVIMDAELDRACEDRLVAYL